MGDQEASFEQCFDWMGGELLVWYVATSGKIVTFYKYTLLDKKINRRSDELIWVLIGIYVIDYYFICFERECDITEGDITDVGCSNFK